MFVDAVAGGAVGALAGIAGACVSEAFLLALRRRRNATFIDAGELPYKDEVFRPKWQLLGAAGMVVGAAARSLGSSFGTAVAAAVVLPVLLAVAGLWFLRR